METISHCVAAMNSVPASIQDELTRTSRHGERVLATASGRSWQTSVVTRSGQMQPRRQRLIELVSDRLNLPDREAPGGQEIGLAGPRQQRRPINRIAQLLRPILHVIEADQET